MATTIDHVDEEPGDFPSLGQANARQAKKKGVTLGLGDFLGKQLPSEAAEAIGERPRLKLQPRSAPVEGKEGSSSHAAAVGQQKANPFGAARPREEVLKEKGIDYLKEEQKLQPRSAPVEGHEGSSSSSHAAAVGQQQQPKKANPFGAARPREEVLKEKGIDYHKEELKLEHGDVMRDETCEEKAMKDEVEQLRKRLELIKASAADPESIADEVAKELDAREKMLYRLQAELDDRVRFGRGIPRERSSECESYLGGGYAADRQQREGRDFNDRQPQREGRDFRDRLPPNYGGRVDYRDHAAPQDRSRDGGGGFGAACRDRG